ncbi:hypothetical protein [Sphingomonas faeni]|jgi:hypothetical protein|uniref:hypothetical protein n=1 Tax=Sphingomonas faeni TaxID=185950 RepID=UPI002787881E|nr:hypothetical protein [Sphingomonas faeni]MDQ0840297.1 hypothetical protein [Sphingomonas faeni]
MSMTPLEVITAKRAHLARFANEGGAAGEQQAIVAMDRWIPRPRGPDLVMLLEELASTGIVIKPSSFDALALPRLISMADRDQVRASLAEITFVEIKTSNQPRVKPGFSGFFFAITENEITAAEQLGIRHRIALFNKITNEILITSVSEILARTKSMNWQLSVQI